jgi:hypothetical protein
VHGGAIAAVLDEAMGGVCWMNGHPVVGARITINYLHLTPLGFEGRVESWIEHIDGRKISIKSKLTGDGGMRKETGCLFSCNPSSKHDSMKRGRVVATGDGSEPRRRRAEKRNGAEILETSLRRDSCPVRLRGAVVWS